MFKELNEILSQSGSALVMSVVKVGEAKLTVNVTPKGTWKDQALGAGLTVTGTPEELDAGLPEQISRFAKARLSLQDQVDNTLRVLEAATSASKGKAAEAIKKSTAPQQAPKAAPQVAQTDDEEVSESADVVDLF